MNEHQQLGPVTPDTEANIKVFSEPVSEPAESQPHPVDPARAEAGRRGGARFHELVKLGRQYEEEHGLTAGRQRLKQLVQLGRRYEQEHGLAGKPRRRRRKGDAWQEFVTALARVVKPAHRAAVEQLAATLQRNEAKAA